MPLLYLHGFNSSPRSHKANQLRTHLGQLGRESALWVPQLSSTPASAIIQAEQLIAAAGSEPVCVLGSSLGGYYATWLAERHRLKAVLINPALQPHRLFRDYLGPQHNPYTGEHWTLTPTHLEQLAALEVKAVAHPERSMVLVQTGDEVLDWTLAAESFRNADLRVFEGGTHAFEGFDILLPDVLAFCGTDCWNTGQAG